MKKSLMLILLAFAGYQSFAQFTISGKIQHPDKPDTITFNIPFIFGNYRENTQRIAVDKFGRFKKVFALTEQKFASFSYHQHNATLLLSPGHNLILTLDTAGIITNIQGTAATENQLLHQANLGEIPYFNVGERGKNPYDKLNRAEVQERIIAPWFKLRDDAVARVNAAKLSARNKALISSEIKYHALAQLDFFIRGILNVDKKEIGELMTLLFQNVSTGPEVYPAGPQYYYFVNGYLSYLEFKAFSQHPPTDERSKKPFMEVYKMSFDSANVLVKKYGKNYIKWHLVDTYFSKKVAEQYLAQAIMAQVSDKDISHAEPLMADFQVKFPNSNYLPLLQRNVSTLALLLQQNKDNVDIKIYDGYQKTTTIAQVLASLKGKVVLLDIWGTWCPACKTELLYTPQIKEHFKGKDVVFLYLDMDDDSKDADWQKFIRINKMTGVHLRKNREEIHQFWAELLPGKITEEYPTYFIFDKSGKLVQAKASYPSDAAALSSQIEKYL